MSIRQSRFFGSRQISRRHALHASAVAGAGLAAALAVACGGSGDRGGSGSGQAVVIPTTAATVDPSAKPVRGGTMTFALTSVDRAVPDPHLSTATGIHSWSLISSTAVSLKPANFEVVGEVVDAWERISPTEYVFNVRSGVNWHNKPPSNGRPVTAEDVAYNLDRIRGEVGPNAPRPRGGGMGPIANIEVVDPSRFKVTMSSPFSPLLAGIADFRNSLVPKDFAESVGFEDPNRFVGCGAFTMDTWRVGDIAQVNRNPSYWRGNDMPYFDNVRIVWLPDDAASASAFSTRAHDWLYADTKVKRESVRAIDKQAMLYNWSSPRVLGLRFHTEKAPFNDPRVRKAIQLVLEYKPIGDDEFGEGYWDYTGPVSSAFPEAIKPDVLTTRPGWNPSTKENDTRTARELMTAAGYPDGQFDLPILSVLGSSGYTFGVSSRIAEQLRKIWPRMNATVSVPSDFAAGNRAMVSGDFVALVYSILAPYDPTLDLEANYHSEGGRNYGRFSDARIDSLITSALTEPDLNKRRGIIDDIQNSLIDDHMYVVTLLGAKTSYWANPQIEGFDGLPGPASTGLYDPVAFADRYWKKQP